jgi:hypothetical protein
LVNKVSKLYVRKSEMIQQVGGLYLGLGWLGLRWLGLGWLGLGWPPADHRLYRLAKGW